MGKTPGIELDDVALDGSEGLWDVMRAALQAKEARPGACLLPAMLIVKSNEIVAKVYQSSQDPRTLLVWTCTGIRKVSLNWHDVLSLLYRTAVLTLQKLGGTAVVFIGERTPRDGRHAMICAMKWTAHQFLRQPPRGAKLPETLDSISQPFSMAGEKVCWSPDVRTALQFS